MLIKGEKQPRASVFLRAIDSVQVLQEVDTTGSRIIIDYVKSQATFFFFFFTFWPCDEKRETRKPCDNWNDGRKKQQGGKQREKMWDGLKKWRKVGRVTEALKATRDRDVWEVMIACAEKQDT